ncbi:hypothetical protein ACWDE9_46580, partial [Streptomyces olivaceoviridis]
MDARVEEAFDRGRVLGGLAGRHPVRPAQPQPVGGVAHGLDVRVGDVGPAGAARVAFGAGRGDTGLDVAAPVSGPTPGLTTGPNSLPRHRCCRRPHGHR